MKHWVCLKVAINEAKLKNIINSTINFSIELVGQNCAINDSTEWEKVEIKIVCPSDLDSTLWVVGEGIIETRKPIKNLNDLSANQKKNLQTIAARDKACLIFICYDKALKTELYYYWVSKFRNSN
jgi:hypothetical protein